MKIQDRDSFVNGVKVKIREYFEEWIDEKCDDLMDDGGIWLVKGHDELDIVEDVFDGEEYQFTSMLFDIFLENVVDFKATLSVNVAHELDEQGKDVFIVYDVTMDGMDGNSRDVTKKDLRVLLVDNLHWLIAEKLFTFENKVL